MCACAGRAAPIRLAGPRAGLGGGGDVIVGFALSVALFLYTATPPAHAYHVIQGLRWLVQAAAGAVARCSAGRHRDPAPGTHRLIRASWRG